jgi:hypothetical protein
VVGTLLVAALATAGGYWWVRWLYAPHRDVREAIASALGAVTADVPDLKVIAPGEVKISFQDDAAAAQGANLILLTYLGHGFRLY